jgi:hypothetical protein
VVSQRGSTSPPYTNRLARVHSWTVRGVKWCPRVECSYKWWYVQVAVDPLSGEVWQRWLECLGKECVVGVVYGALAAKMAAVAGALDGLRDGMVRLAGWDWIREALARLPCD